jgi:nucleoside-triphosphatase THEP1
MDYLDELKKRVAAAFENATEKQDIDNLSSINAAIDGLQNEQEQLMAKNKELIAAYKDAVMHPGLSKEQPKDVTDVPQPAAAPDLAQILLDQMSNK